MTNLSQNFFVYLGKDTSKIKALWFVFLLVMILYFFFFFFDYLCHFILMQKRIMTIN